MALNIRKATVEDASSISAIAQELQIGDERLPAAGQTGFLLWAQQPDTYVHRINHSDHFVVAEEDTEVVGFLMAYSLQEIATYFRDMPYEDDVLSLFFERYDSSVIYPDQIGVLPSHKRKGVGGLMDDYLTSLCPNVGFATVIGHAPIWNEASIGYFTSRRYQLAQEIQQDDWTLGLYERNITIKGT